MNDERCLWCGEPSVALCDFWLGTVPHPEDGLIDLDGEHFTCDAPLCAKHRRPYGHICGPGAGPHDVDLMDHCPAHERARKPSWPECAKNHRAAQSMRDAVRVAAFRSRMRPC